MHNITGTIDGDHAVRVLRQEGDGRFAACELERARDALQILTLIVYKQLLLLLLLLS